MRVSRQENPEKQGVWQKAYRKRHPERCREQDLRFRAKWIDKIRKRDYEKYWADPEGNREYVRQWRLNHLDKVRQRGRELHQVNKVKRNAECKRWKRKRFFYERARKWEARHGYAITPLDLWCLWKKQRGLCALTGRKLDGRRLRGAALDHIVARANGGTGKPENLRWLCYEANLAKGILRDEELMRLCADILWYDWGKKELVGHFDVLPRWVEGLKCGIGLPA